MITTDNFQDKWEKLFTLLLLNVKPQFYKEESLNLSKLRDSIKECATENLYLTCQHIIYSRYIMKEKKIISYVASVLIAPYLSGKELGKRFYTPFDEKKKKGGIIFKPDDMQGIFKVYLYLNHMFNTKLTNSMKKGFRATIESYDTHSLLKYKTSLINIINLVHPRPHISQATIEINKDNIYTIDAIIQGIDIPTNTNETKVKEILLQTTTLSEFNTNYHINKVRKIVI